MSEVVVKLVVNGNAVKRKIWREEKLVDFLHDELNMPGTRFCCGIGVCRACTVLVRNTETAPAVPMLSCSIPVTAVDGQSIETVEGLAAEGGQLSALQEAFLKHFSFQCGYCPPGFLMAATGLLERLMASPIPRAEIDDAIANACGEHICRCTGYVRYYQAIREVIEQTPGTILDAGTVLEEGTGLAQGAGE